MNKYAIYVIDSTAFKVTNPVCTGCNWTACLAYAKAYREDFEQQKGYKPEVSIIDAETGEVLYTLKAVTPLECADFSVRTYNTLKRYGINTIEELKLMPIGDFRKVRNFGAKCFCEVVQYLLAEQLQEPCTVTLEHGSTVYSVKTIH